MCVDSKRPDGFTLIPWQKGRYPVWDVTVVDITVASYLAVTTTVAESAANSAAVRQEIKYVELSNSYQFFPITIESHGPLSNKGTSFLSDLCWRVTISTSDARKQVHFFNESPCHYKNSMLSTSLTLSMI